MSDATGPILIIFSGLPGAGKTSLARALATAIGATHLRIDTIEQAILASGKLQGSLDDAGYRVGYALAEDNLRLGRIVIADSVNPLALTRDAWRSAALRAGAPAIEVEIVCSDTEMHRARVERRAADIASHVLPTWEEVRERHYEPWHRRVLVIDTARLSLAEAVAAIQRALSSGSS